MKTSKKDDAGEADGEDSELMKNQEVEELVETVRDNL